MLNNVDNQWGRPRTIDCPYQPAGSYRAGISVRWPWSLLRDGVVTIQRITNNTVYSVNPTTYSLTINNFTPLLYGDYRCILEYDINDIHDNAVNGDYNEAPTVPVHVAISGSSGIDMS